MEESSIALLQQAAQAVSESSSREESIHHLKTAFDLFSRETDRLSKEYQSLKAQLQSVNLELEISNQKLNQKVAELDTVTHYLDNILGNMTQGIIFVGLSGIVTTFNQAAEDILSLQSEGILFKSFWDSFPDEYFGFSLKEALKMRNSQGNLILSFRDQNSELREIEVNTITVNEGEQSYQGLILLLKDVTDVRRFRRIARRNDRMQELGEMAAALAHEIRNPLGGIEGFASLLFRDLEGNEQQQQMAKNVLVGTQELNSLVSRVLDYSRPVHMHYESIELIQFFNEIIDFMKKDSAFKENISLSLESEISQCILRLDRISFKSCIINLLLNAYQAVQDNGKIVIRVYKKEGHALIEVEDNGKGISSKNLEKIFSPFFTTRHDGTGFGLSEVYKVIAAHDGAIEVNSEEGKGTSFLLKLPLSVARMGE